MLDNARLAQEVARDLFAEGVYAVGFFFPVVAKGQARIRTQLSAAHPEAQLMRAIHAFTKVGKAFGILGRTKDEIVARVYGSEGYIYTDYFGSVWIRGNEPFPGGSTGNGAAA